MEEEKRREPQRVYDFHSTVSHGLLNLLQI